MEFEKICEILSEQMGIAKENINMNTSMRYWQRPSKDRTRTHPSVNLIKKLSARTPANGLPSALLSPHFPLP